MVSKNWIKSQNDEDGFECVGGNSIKRVILRIIHTSCDKYCTIIKVYHYAHKFMSVINQRKTIVYN